MTIMAENTAEDIPDRYKSPIQDFVFFYCKENKELAESYVNQLRSLGYTGCLYDDQTYLNWRPTYDYDLAHELSRISVAKFFLVTSELEHDSDVHLHRCETLSISIKNKDSSLVPIFEINKDDIPDTSEFYGLRSLTGLYSNTLRDGKKFKWYFDLPSSKKRKRSLESDRQLSLEEWIVEEKERLESQPNVEDAKKKEKRKRERQRERRLRDENPEGAYLSGSKGRKEEGYVIHETNYHINIQEAAKSEIKIGPTYVESEDKEDSSHKSRVMHQFSTDGGGWSGPTSMVSGSDPPLSDSFTRDEGMLDDSQETSSVEFNIPDNPEMAPVRMNDGPKTTSAQRERETVDEEETDNKKPKKPEATGASQKQFDFQRFLDDDNLVIEDKDEPFSEDHLVKRSQDNKGNPLADVHAKENRATGGSLSSEVDPWSIQQPATEASTIISDVFTPPPWAPVSSSSTQSTSHPDLGGPNRWGENQQGPKPQQDSIILNTLDSTEIVINMKQLHAHGIEDSPAAPRIPELSKLLSEGCSVSLTEHPQAVGSEESSLQSKVEEQQSLAHGGEASLNGISAGAGIVPQQPESTPVSIQDAKDGEAVNVSVCDSEEFQNVDNVEVVATHSLTQSVVGHNEEGREHSGNHSHAHGPLALGVHTHPLGDSGIEMDQITETTHGLLMSGYQQLSTTSVSEQSSNRRLQFENPSQASCIQDMEGDDGLERSNQNLGYKAASNISAGPCTDDKSANFRNKLACEEQSNTARNEINLCPKSLVSVQMKQEAHHDKDFKDAVSNRSDDMKDIDGTVRENKQDLEDSDETVGNDSRDIAVVVYDLKDDDAEKDIKKGQVSTDVNMKGEGTGYSGSIPDEEWVQSIEEVSDDLEEIRLNGTWL